MSSEPITVITIAPSVRPSVPRLSVSPLSLIEAEALGTFTMGFYKAHEALIEALVEALIAALIAALIEALRQALMEAPALMEGLSL